MFYFVVAIYNARKYLRECLNSFLAQEPNAYSVVLVNDGSTDDSADICREYCGAHSNFHLISTENHGPLHARVTGLNYVLEHAAPSDYVWFVDSDDWIAPESLSVLNEVLKNSEYDLVGMNYYDNESTIAPTADHAPKVLDGAGQVALNILTDCEMSGVLWRYVYSVGAIQSFDVTPYTSLRFCEDALQNVMMIEGCKRGIFIDRRLYHYRECATSLSHSNLLPKILQSFTADAAIKATIERRGIWTEDDWKIYMKSLQGWAGWCMDTLVFSDRSFKEKKSDLSKLAECAFFREIIAGKQSSPAARLMLAGCFGSVILLKQARRSVRNLKKKLKS